MSERWTPDQKRAITETGHNVIVSAGAGSGKTAVLTARVLHFVENHGYSIRDFLVLTFTKAAAGEMKNRIRLALRKAGSPEADYVDASDISTFDSFFLSLVRRHHLELGISGDLGIMEDYVDILKRREIVHDLLLDLVTKGDESLSAVAVAFPYVDEKTLVDWVLALHDLLLETGEPDEALARLRENLDSGTYVDSLVTGLEEKIRELVEEFNGRDFDLATLKFGKKGNYVDFEPLYRSFYRKAIGEGYEGLRAFGTSCPRPSVIKDEEYRQCSQPFRDALNALKAELSEFPESVESIARSAGADKKLNLLLSSLVSGLHSKIEQWKKENGLYVFSDIARMALHLAKKKEVQEELANRYKMIMVDEFQDTSLIQNDFIDLIGDGRLYMVGDVKQSIYLFRSARPDLFQKRYLAYKEGKGGVAIDMNANFRSRKQVLSGVNAIFSRIMDEELGGVDYRHGHVITFGNLSYEGKGRGSDHSSEILLFDAKGLSAEKKAEKEARCIAADIKRRIKEGFEIVDRESGELRKAGPSDFTIITDRKTRFDLYRRVFEEYRLPLHLDYEENIVDNDLVRTIGSLFTLFLCLLEGDYASGSFRHAYFSVARSFLYGFDDDELFHLGKNPSALKASQPVQDVLAVVTRRANIPDSLILKELLQAVSLEDKLISIGDVQRNEGYVDAILGAYQSLVRAHFPIVDFPRIIKGIRDLGLKIEVSSSPSAPEAVKMINIHKSKGLEYPVIYFAGLNNPYFENEFRRDSLYLHLMTGLHPRVPDGSNNPFALLDRSSKLLEKRSEQVRLLYVALTRSREKSIFLFPEDGKGGSPLLFNHFLASIAEGGLGERKARDAFRILKALGISFDPVREEMLRGLLSKELDEEGKAELSSVLSSFPRLIPDGELIRAYLETHELNQAGLPSLFSFLGLGEEPGNFLLKASGPLARSRERKSDSFAVSLVYRALGLPLRHSEDVLSNRGGLDVLGLIDVKGCHDALLERGKPLNPYRAVFDVLCSGERRETKAEALTLLGLDLTTRQVDLDHPSSYGEIVSMIGGIDEKRKDAKCFLALLRPVFMDGAFPIQIVDSPSPEIAPEIEEETIYEAPEIIPFLFAGKEGEEASKSYSEELRIDSSQDSLVRGSELHLLMEGFDFSHPVFDGLSPEEGAMIKRFLSSPVATGIEQATIYHEYGFVDESGRQGSIDLLLLFGDRARVIDYKTSGIDDPAYDEQVKGYMEVVSAIFHLPVEGYLYSLSRGTHRKINLP